MSSYPDFSPQGYEIIRELGRNREGGRITWLASNLDTGQKEVVKQFCFAQSGSNWSAFSTYQREIQVLRSLNHPGIPRYIGALETADGFCMIQEYINAESLAEYRSFEPEEIKQIAISALEILVYLQNLHPPVIHRDVKPENILVDNQLQVYLIDFGFARIGTQEAFGSSLFKGTPGFMPPEQMLRPTEASDLYGLGVTLICLLTGISSTAILELSHEDDPYLLQFRNKLPTLSLVFIDWLEKMVQPNVINRFANAAAALEELKTLDVFRMPRVKLSARVLDFRATRLGEMLRKTVTVNNPVPKTMLQGRWEVAPHPHDPPHSPDSHAWISVSPHSFAYNPAKCQVEVDTSKLMADEVYRRQLLLHTNSSPTTHTVTIKVLTAPLAIERREIPYILLAGLFLCCAIASIAITWLIPVVMAVIETKGVVLGLDFRDPGSGAVAGGILGTIVGAVVGAVVGEIFTGFDEYRSEVPPDIAILVGAAISCVSTLGGSVLGALSQDGPVNLVVVLGTFIYICVMIFSCGWLVALPIWFVAIFLTRAVHKLLHDLWLLLTAGLGISLGIGYIVGFFNPYILLALAGTGLPLIVMLVYPPLKRGLLIGRYRNSKKLIKPDILHL